MWIFLAVAATILSALVTLAGFRLLLPLRLGAGLSALAWTALQVFSLLPLALLALRRHYGLGRASEWLAFAGWIVVGWLSVALVLAAARDLTLVGLRLVGGAQALAAGSPALWADAGRQALVSRAAARLIVAAAGLLVLAGLAGAYRVTRVARVEVPIPDLHPGLDGLTIAQLSDLHIGPGIGRGTVARMARAAAELRAELFVLTGDLADGMPGDLAAAAAPLAELAAPLGKWFITGNHEYYSDPLGWLRVARGLGFGTLVNEHVLLERGGGRLLLAGVPDLHGGRMLPAHASRPEQALEGAPAADFRLLLAHQPASVFAAERAGFDLMLSGHTHGGQYLPWNWLAARANPYLKGLHRHGRMWIYVSRGTGYWGPPIRLGAPAEITLLTLRREDGP